MILLSVVAFWMSGLAVGVGLVNAINGHPWRMIVAGLAAVGWFAVSVVCSVIVIATTEGELASRDA
jgi:hypothetical protein